MLKQRIMKQIQFIENQAKSIDPKSEYAKSLTIYYDLLNDCNEALNKSEIQLNKRNSLAAPELEQAVLGAIMIEKDAIIEAQKAFKNKNIFVLKKHQLIYATILYMQKKSYPIDLLTVIHYLRCYKRIDEIGGPEYIAELTSKVSSSANIEHHCFIIHQCWIKSKAVEILNNCFDKINLIEIDDPFEYIDKIILELQSLCTKEKMENEKEII